MRYIFSLFCIFSWAYLSADPVANNQEQPSFFEALELFLNQSGQSPEQTDSKQAVTSSLKELLQEIKEETKNGDPNQPMLIVDDQKQSSG